MEFLAIQGLSKSEKHPILIFRSTSNQSLCFKFHWKATNQTCFSYICLGCKQGRDAGNSFVIKSIKVSFDYQKFMSNPEALNHQCVRLNFTFDYLTSVVQQDLRNANKNVKFQGTKPSIALANLHNLIGTKYNEDNQRAYLTLPSRHSILQTFSRKRRLIQPENFDPLMPPENLYASKLTDNNQQSLLLRSFSAVSPPFMYLADRTNLLSIYNTDVLMFDGTFEYCPREFYKVDYEIENEVRTTSGQTYTMHSVYSNLPERQSSFLSGIAFLPHKSEATYVQLFREVRRALENEFGSIGKLKTVMLDFEIAAHNAVNEIFPEWTIRTCYFHFIKNVKDQAKKKKVSKIIRMSIRYKRWINELFGSVFLPVEYARQTFEHLLDNLPATGDNFNNFATYLRRFWLPKLDKIICWDNTQPRTNNPAECYHSKLQKAFEHEKHPKIGSAFDVHSNHLADSAIEFLKFGGSPAKLQLRTKKRRNLDKKLMDAQNKLINFINSLQEVQEMPIEYLLKYCRHIRFLTGNLMQGSTRTNPDARLIFDPLPEPEVQPVLQRLMLRPNVLGVVLLPTPVSSQSTDQT